jgi:hypothetical protein
MAKLKLVALAEKWTPDPDDPLGEDKKRLIHYLLDNEVTSTTPVTLAKILAEVKFTQKYRREALQHQLLGPLRRERNVFIGTSNAGVFLVTTPEDVDTTLGFYTWRIRAELRHARNLRALAKRTNLLAGYKSKIPATKERAVIYIDESGNPDVGNLDPPVFVIAAVVIQSRQNVAGLEQRFQSAFAVIQRPPSHELRSAGLSVAKHARVLRELSLLEYQWAAACFNKAKLTSAGFADPSTFYRYAFQFLIGDLLTVAWQSDLVIDENSTADFQSQLKQYLRRQNSGLPVNRLGSVKFSASSKQRLIQLADLVAGAVRRSVKGDAAPLKEIEHQMIDLQFWPPK